MFLPRPAEPSRTSQRARIALHAVPAQQYMCTRLQKLQQGTWASSRSATYAHRARHRKKNLSSTAVVKARER